MKTLTQQLWRIPSLAAILAATALMSACASNPVALETVGPKPAKGIAMTGEGSLVVFTATEARRLDKTVPYYVHSSYTINRKDGHKFKWVENHSGDMDSAPQLVTIPAGEYVIHANSEDYGTVDVPVVIGGARTTEVYLDGTWGRHQHGTETANLVRLPNGHIVGWSASGKANPG